MFSLHFRAHSFVFKLGSIVLGSLCTDLVAKLYMCIRAYLSSHVLDQVNTSHNDLTGTEFLS